ncbi:UrcA family protein [Marinicauda algicola]|uniref:UrcA family protein n=1 Tax=Marinicauda algicola TaxID=2029849 RepID=A0A4S2H243_9PROT|nr:UrcA family protein [Marinicauda algicola]TGY89655.1 UrcA family protein [Marinicauda algicola]
MSLPRHLALAALAVGLAAFQPVPAAAQPVPAQSRAIEVHAADLATPQQAEALYRRIEAAAISACRAENRHGADYARSIRLCSADAIARTIAAIDSPLLIARHREQFPALALASRE